jgi:hypothetical protein
MPGRPPRTAFLKIEKPIKRFHVKGLDEKHMVVIAAAVLGSIIYWLIASDPRSTVLPAPVADALRIDATASIP